jgi:hypothetical protein
MENTERASTERRQLSLQRLATCLQVPGIFAIQQNVRQLTTTPNTYFIRRQTMNTLLRTFAIALLATAVTGFAQPADEKPADNNKTMTQKEIKKQEKKAKKQAKPAKTKNTDQEKEYDPTAGIWG